MSIEITHMARKNYLKTLVDEINGFRTPQPSAKVTPMVSPEEIRDHLKKHFEFSKPRALAGVIEGVAEIMHRWSLHTTNPKYFGLFNPNVTEAAIAADALAALYNPQLATWSHAPCANEIEQWTLEFFLKRFGFPPETSAAHFTSGGAEANHTAVITALTRYFPSYGNGGVRSLPAQPVLYVSEQAHHSFFKIAHSTGIGRDAIRIVPVDRSLQMDLRSLERMIAADEQNGFLPFMVVGTIGTTPAGVIDPLADIARICATHRLWFHADGAWGGAAAFSHNGALLIPGIELADSITCDAHKWLSVSMSAGMFFCRHKDAVGEAFRITTSYMPEQVHNTIDPYAASLQWSRRFIGLKVFMTLSERGADGLAAMIDSEIALGDHLRELLIHSGWKIVNNTPLPVVCFTHADLIEGTASADELLKKLYDDGEVWISGVTIPHYGFVLRACIINYLTTAEDVAALVQTLGEALGEVTAKVA
jgi:glutamate/tyrosine decarboxylase-like PLP-dependent enzyme